MGVMAEGVLDERLDPELEELIRDRGEDSSPWGRRADNGGWVLHDTWQPIRPMPATQAPEAQPEEQAAPTDPTTSDEEQDGTRSPEPALRREVSKSQSRLECVSKRRVQEALSPPGSPVLEDMLPPVTSPLSPRSTPFALVSANVLVDKDELEALSMADLAMSISLRYRRRAKEVSCIRSYHQYTLRGHPSRVKCVGMVGEGLYVTCCHSDTSVSLRSIETDEEFSTFTGHTDIIVNLAISSCFRLLATASRDCSLRLWDISTAKLVVTIEHERVVTCCTFTPDGSKVISGSQDKILRVWDVQEWTLLLQFTGHSGVAFSVAVSPCGLYACSGAADRMLCIWRIADGETDKLLRGHTGPVQCVAYSSEGKTVLSSESAAIKLWDCSTGACLTTIPLASLPSLHIVPRFRRAEFTLVAFAPGVLGMRYVVAASNNRTVYIIDTRTGAEVLSLSASAPVYALAVGIKPQVTFGDSNGNIYVADLDLC